MAVSLSPALLWRLGVATSVGLALALAGAALVVARGSSSPAVRTPADQRSTRSDGSHESHGSDEGEVVVAQARPARRHGAVSAEVPRAVRLPGGRVVPVRAVGTRPDGLLDVPRDIRTAGWWRGGSRLGDPLGATLLAAHVDSATQGLGPYAALLGSRPGQRLALTSAHLRQDFRVESLRLVPQGDLSRRSWIHGVAGRRRLVLVTCAPPYDRARGGYQNLAVVTAVPANAPTPREDR